VIHLKLNEIRKTHRDVFERCEKHAAAPYSARFDFRARHCLVAEQYYAKVISLPMYPGPAEWCHDQVISALREELNR
jgi:dTDP-4-amino-4,6-dideoxygalactose transaminase